MSTTGRRDEIQLARAVAAWLMGLRSANTRAAYQADIDDYLQWWDANRGGSPLDVVAADVDAYRAAVERTGSSGATASRRVSAVSSFYRHAASAGVLSSVPAPSIRPRSTASATPTLTADEVVALEAASRALGGRHLVLVDLLLYDGLKLAEILAANAQDVSLTTPTARLRVDGRATLTLDVRTAADVRALLAGRTIGPLLQGNSATATHARLTRFGADYLLKQVGTRAGLNRAISANVLRRAHATAADSNGERIEDIAVRMGHQDVRTTRRLTR
jgi:integrase/recombinase XerD